MTTIVKAADSAQFLSLIPPMLGYVPRHSLVLVPFAQSRSLGALRIDLPEDDGDAETVAATCIGMVCRLARADGFAAIVYTDRPYADATPHADLIAALELRAHTCGLDVRDLLCVAEDGWGSYLDPQGPPLGRDLTELSVDDRFEVAADQHAGTDLPEVTEQQRADAADAYQALRFALTLVCTDEPVDESDRVDPRALSAACRLDDLPALFEQVLQDGPDRLDAFTAAVMIWTLMRPSCRDIALVQWCADQDTGIEAARAQLAWENGGDYPPELAERILGEGPRPDLARLERALAVCRSTAALAPEPYRPGALAACGWLSWALGRSTHAERYASAACAIDPDHGMAEIVTSLVEIGRLPGWAFDPEGRGL